MTCRIVRRRARGYRRDRESPAVGSLEAGIALHELAPAHESLEEAYLALTHDAVEYQTTTDSTTNTRRAA